MNPATNPAPNPERIPISLTNTVFVYSDLARDAARYIAEKIVAGLTRQDRFTLVLSGGSTPKAVFAHLASEHGESEHGEIDWTKVHLFWGDERNVPITHVDSNQGMAKAALIDHIPIPAANVHWIATGKVSPEAAAALYASELRQFFSLKDLKDEELPQFDLILLGLGDDGHTASLFPDTDALHADDHLLVVANPVPKLDTTRVTFTRGVITTARQIAFLVGGAGKAVMIREVLLGTPNRYPSQLVAAAAPAVAWLLDVSAAAGLDAHATA